MNRLSKTSWSESMRPGLALAIVLALSGAGASGADRITRPEQNNLLTPPTQPAPQQQVVRTPPRFLPPRPSRESPAAFTPDMPFSQAIDILRNSTQPPLNLVVLWREIEENAGVDRNTPIGIDGLRGLRLGQCLKTLLISMSATATTKIGYVVDHGFITIATVDSLPIPKPVTRVYDISDLVAPPSRPMGFGMMPGMMPGMGMMPGLGGGMPYGGYGTGGGNYAPGYGTYNSGYGNYSGMPGYNSAGNLPSMMNSYQGTNTYRR